MLTRIKFFIAGPMVAGCLSFGLAAFSVVVIVANYVANKGRVK